MIFKLPHLKDELFQSPKRLVDVANAFESLSIKYGVVPVVTRVWGKIEGDSGVHDDKRAVDFRSQYFDEHGKPKWLYTVDTVDAIVKQMNLLFPRDDGKKVCIHHSFQGGPFHFHLQIPKAWAIT